MSFSSDWLALRASADTRARDAALLDAAAGALTARGVSPLIVDIGCGTGATVRALRDKAPVGTRWRLVDVDDALLAAAGREASGADLVKTDLAALGPDGMSKLLTGADLITASAFFDLTSAAWIAAFAAAAPRSAAIYAALTYDGQETWRPSHPDDAAMLAAFHAHQGGDKGFGPALGPRAATGLIAALTAEGYRVRSAASPWRLSRARDGALMDALADGVVGAVAELGVSGDAWRAAPRESCEIGHIDVLAEPPATP